MDRVYDVILIGAGPANLFAADTLAESGLSILIVDKGDLPDKRRNVSFGIGGAGAFSDGKLNLTSRIGGDPSSIGRSPEEVEYIIEKIDRTFTELGVEGGYTESDGKKVTSLMKRAASAGVEFIFARQRHIGTDRLRTVSRNFYERLINKGVKFLVNTEVKDIKKAYGDFKIVCRNGALMGKSVIAAPGRAGAYWLREVARKLGIQTLYGPIDVGVRVEFPAIIYADIAEVMYDAKFRLYTRSYDDLVRTFCTNPNGYIVKEEYDEFVLVNGHAKWKSKTNNTNFALLSRVTLTDPVEDTTKYGRDIARLATTIGGGKPIIQRLTDFMSGRRSTPERISKSLITPTLKEVTPGDIAMAFPHRIVRNLTEGLEVLDKIISGLNSSNTLLYAPEIKFYDTRYIVNKFMETNLKNFFVAGDASGHSRGIVYSAITGIFAAEGVLRNLSKSNAKG